MNSRSLLLLSFCLFSNFVWGQWRYVITDPDEYTNVRKHPNANSEILGKLSKFHVFSTPWSSCVYDGQVEVDENSNWLPILINEDTNEVGYVYKKNIADLDNFPQLNIQRKDSLNAYFKDKDIEINLYFEKNPIFGKFVEDDYLNNTPHYLREGYYLLKKIQATIQEKKLVVTGEGINPLISISNPSYCYEDAINRLCNITLFKGPNTVYYLVIDDGDGGDVYSAIWVITKEKIHFDGFQTHCSFFNITLDK